MNTPAEIAKNYVGIGRAKLNLPAAKMLVLGILAGMFIAFGAAGSQAAAVSIAEASFGKLLGALVFPVGLMLVLCAGSELFTGNCLLVIPVLEKEGKLGQLLKSWILVYLGNVIGGVLTALLVVGSHLPSMFGGGLAQAMVSTAEAKVSMSFTDALLRGILCNILVCLAVWVSFAAKELAGKIAGLYLPVMLFVLCGFEHSVANAYFIPAGMLASAVFGIGAENLSVGAFLLNNLLPVTLGNLLGGALLGLTYWSVYLKQKKSC